MLLTLVKRALLRLKAPFESRSARDTNQLNYLKRHLPSASGPILEVGSKANGDASNFRSLYSGQEYIGIDIEPGPNVERVVNLAEAIDGLQEGYFSFAICCSVLEHVAKPWVFAEHLTKLIRRDGVLYMSVPWVWSFHASPDDYYRFSWRAIIELFPEFEWSNICYSTLVPNEFFDISQDRLHIDNELALIVESEEGPRKYLPCLMVNMLGRKKTS